MCAPRTASGCRTANQAVTRAPTSLPDAKNESYPSRVIRIRHRSAMDAAVIRSMGSSASEYAKPGIDGTTTWNASSASPPYLSGRVRRSSRGTISRNELGHPWVTMIGLACGWGLRACRKCVRAPSMVMRKWGSA